MTKRIKLPLDSEAYLRKAGHFLQEDKMEEALEYVGKAYELNKELTTNIYYTFLLVQSKRYTEALEVINKEKSFYMNDEIHASLYAQVLTEANHFLEAEYIIQKYKNDPAKIDDATWEMLEQELVQKREDFNLAEDERKKRLKQSLREIEQYPQMVQVRKISNAKILDLFDLQEIAPSLLVNPSLSGIVKGSLIELLIQKRDSTVYSFLWFNEVREICPVEMSKFTEIELIHDLKNKTSKKLAKHPDLRSQVDIELMNDLILLYPYIEEVITDLDFWLDAYISKLDFFNRVKVERIVVNKEQEEMMKWIDHLNIISQRDEIFKD